jgi:hypothetical protein
MAQGDGGISKVVGQSPLPESVDGVGASSGSWRELQVPQSVAAKSAVPGAERETGNRFAVNPAKT